MYKYSRHNVIVDLLGRLDADLLRECECYFAGGTAIALQLDEHRRSDDIDFLCASTPGYRRLREIVFDGGVAALGTNLPIVRGARADQYGIRAVLATAEEPVKFEIVREARVGLSASKERIAGISYLSRRDLYLEKLLANVDRGMDRSSLHRDFIDLCVMIRRWGDIPEDAMSTAQRAYGTAVARAFARVASLLRHRSRLDEVMSTLDAGKDTVVDVVAVLQRHAKGELAGLAPAGDCSTD